MISENNGMRALTKTLFPGILLSALLIFLASPAWAGGLYLEEVLTPSMGTAECRLSSSGKRCINGLS